MDPHVVLLEDDLELRSLVTRGLREEGFRVTSAGTAAEVLALVDGPRPDALVVDIGLPDADGRDVVQALRAQGLTTPVIFLTARDALTDRLSGFAAGGDDYLTKPFAFAELVARLHALVKRGGSDLVARVANLTLDPSAHAASCDGDDDRPHSDRVPPAGPPRCEARERRPAPPARRSGLGARSDRPRQHARRLHRPPAPQARAASRGARDRNGARRRLLAPVTRPVRLGVRTRLLLAAVGAVALALVIGVAAFNLFLGQRLSASATSLARAQAAAELSSLEIVDGKLVSPSGLEEGAAVGSPVWVFSGTTILEKPRVPASLTAAAAALAGGPERATRFKESLRLYALPVTNHGDRVGTVVAGVSLAPYNETATIALIGSLGLALLLLAAVALLSHWILGKALLPVSRMTDDAADWSAHDLDRRFNRASPTTSSPSSRQRSTRCSSASPRACAMSSGSPPSCPTSCERRSRGSQARASSLFAGSGPGTPTAQASRRYTRNAEQMTRTVEALVAAARQEAGLSRATSDARDGVRAAVEAVHGQAATAGIALSSSCPPGAVQVAIEPELLERIVQPLLENALRYGRSLVSVELGVNGTSALVTVGDDGAGLAPDETERIFEPGVRGSAAADEPRGAGLGLALARRLARTAGGEVSAEADGDGARVQDHAAACLRAPSARQRQWSADSRGGRSLDEVDVEPVRDMARGVSRMISL